MLQDTKSFKLQRDFYIMIKAGKTSAVEELLKPGVFRADKSSNMGKPAQTQTKPEFIKTGNKNTARGLDETSIIDIVLEKSTGVGQCVGVYIYPSNEKISDLLKKIEVKDRVSIKKEIAYIEAKDKFLKRFPEYTDSFVFRDAISRYGYKTRMQGELIRGTHELN